MRSANPTQNERRWAATSALTGILVPGGIVVFGQALGREDGPGRVAGLIQRITIALGWSWWTALALFALREEGPRASAAIDAGHGSHPGHHAIVVWVRPAAGFHDATACASRQSEPSGP